MSRSRPQCQGMFPDIVDRLLSSVYACDWPFEPSVQRREKKALIARVGGAQGVSLAVTMFPSEGTCRPLHPSPLHCRTMGKRLWRYDHTRARHGRRRGLWHGFRYVLLLTPPFIVQIGFFLPLLSLTLTGSLLCDGCKSWMAIRASAMLNC